MTAGSHPHGLPFLARLSEVLLEVEESLRAFFVPPHPSPSHSSPLPSAIFERLRDVTLSVAVLDRAMAEHTYTVLQAVRARKPLALHPSAPTLRRPSPRLPLAQLVSLLQAEGDSGEIWRVLPAGGNISLVYHMVSCLQTLNTSLKDLREGGARREKGVFIPFLTRHFGPIFVAGLLVALSFSSPTSEQAVLARIRAWRLAERARAWFLLDRRRALLFSLLPLFGLGVHMLAKRLRERRVLHKLTAAHETLLILLRLWTISRAVGGIPSHHVSPPAEEGGPPPAAMRPHHLRGAQSYTVLVASLGREGEMTGEGGGGVRGEGGEGGEGAPLAERQEGEDGGEEDDGEPDVFAADARKPIARRLLEHCALPRASALWPQQGPKYALLYKGLSIFYASAWKGWTCSHPSLSLPVALLAAGRYLLFPQRAVEDSARIMVEPDIRFITWCWRLQDHPLIAGLSEAVLTVRRNQWLRALVGKGGGFFLSRPWDAAEEEEEEEEGGAEGRGQEQPPPSSSSASRGASPLIGAVTVAERYIAGVRCKVIANVPLPDSAWGEREGLGEGEARAPQSTTRSRVHIPPPSMMQVPHGAGVDVLRASPLAPAEGERHQGVEGDAAAPPPLPPILLFIHGGGFVGESWSSDAHVLARWVSLSPFPFTIVYPFYPLAPEHRHPAALNSVTAVYTQLRGRTPRLVLGGESAGGLIATATAIRVIQLRRGGGGGGGGGGPQRFSGEGTQHNPTTPLPHPLLSPTALCLFYPSLNLTFLPSPSRSLHMSDPLVPYHLIIKLCATFLPLSSAGTSSSSSAAAAGAAGVPPSSPSPLLGALPPPSYTSRFNPLLHPVNASDGILSLFPPTRICAGGLDPLLDESVDLSTRLRRLRVPCELEVVRPLPHGFFNFHFLPGAEESLERMRVWVMGMCQE